MSEPRKPLSAELDVREWVKYAQSDLRAAEFLFGINDPPCTIVAYHAQQAAEKMLKAFVVSKGAAPPYVHNIRALLEHCAPYAIWTESLRDAEGLTRFATTSRYPGIGLTVTAAEAEDAMRLARLVCDRVRQALVDDGIEV